MFDDDPNIQQTIHVSVDENTREQWHELLTRFTDASLYQTWDYDALRWGEHRLSHLVLYRAGEVVAAAQVRIVKVPLIQRGIAYVYGGPMWRRRQTAPDYTLLADVLDALHFEYVVKRKLVLRIVPLEPAQDDERILRPLADRGFFRLSAAKPYQSFLVDLTHPETDLMRDMRPTWRRRLRKAQNRDLSVEIGSSDELFQEFLQLYDQMRERKQFVERVNVREFAAIQSRLPDALKMEITACRSATAPLAATVCGTIGATSQMLLLATSNEALKLDASYLTLWHAMLSVRTRGMAYFDLGGVDPEENPGGYAFKSGLGGTNIFHIGTYEACDSAISHAITHVGLSARNSLQNSAAAIKRLRARLTNTRTAPSEPHPEEQ